MCVYHCTCRKTWGDSNQTETSNSVRKWRVKRSNRLHTCSKRKWLVITSSVYIRLLPLVSDLWQLLKTNSQPFRSSSYWSGERMANLFATQLKKLSLPTVSSKATFSIIGYYLHCNWLSSLVWVWFIFTIIVASPGEGMRGGVVEPNDQSKGDEPDDPGATAPRDGLEEGEGNPMDWLPGAGQPDLAGRACRHTMMCVYCFTSLCVPIWS